MQFQISKQIQHLLAHKPFMPTSSEIIQVLSQIYSCQNHLCEGFL